jgi:hypothetical protein
MRLGRLLLLLLHWLGLQLRLRLRLRLWLLLLLLLLLMKMRVRMLLNRGLAKGSHAILRVDSEVWLWVLVRHDLLQRVGLLGLWVLP